MNGKSWLILAVAIGTAVWLFIAGEDAKTPKPGLNPVEVKN